MPARYALTPTQQLAFDELIRAAVPGQVVVLLGNQGTGRTSLLGRLGDQLGGKVLGAQTLEAVVRGHHPLALEDAFYDMVGNALDANPVVMIDDFQYLSQTIEGCRSYPRGGFITVATTALAERVAERGATLVIASEGFVPSLARAGARVVIRELTVDDYRAVCSAYLREEQIASLDFAKIFRFARRMNARQLRRACESTREKLNGETATDAFIDYLRAAQLISNVDLGEVQTVTLQDLKGMDDVIRALEANVIMPLEHSELADELSLKPKRGVLLAGPPGTGKTTVGRALAHRLRGKFFLVDGTVIAGTPMFYNQLHAVFEAAMRNAPSVVFIDDSDVIFEGQDPGLYRYLLTMLDGLESESAGGVCLVLTAMDVGSLPPALVRSGRIELWLETKLPDQSAREAILRDLCGKLPASVGAIDVERLAAATEQLSGADLKRLVDDGKLLYAFDRAQNIATREPIEYFLEALETVRANKLRYAQAEASAKARNPSRPPYFDLPVGIGAMSRSRAAFVAMKADLIETGG
jgi:AAA+ superfamily predicted ATPase